MMADENNVFNWNKFTAPAASVGALLLVFFILLGISFSSMEYYEFGFSKRRSTGSVDTSRVYTRGLHLIGPDYTFKKFPASAHLVALENLAIFTSDRLEVIMTVSFQYFLKNSDLNLLHEEYDLYYEPILISNARDAIKSAATLFSTRDFVVSRVDIEKDLNVATRNRLGGTCCLQGCENSGNCISGCISYSNCTQQNKGFFAEVRYFQMGRVSIPTDVEQRFLEALILQEDTERESFIQEAALVTIETNRQVTEIRNLALEVANNATADAALIAAYASANATATVEDGRQRGLSLLYTTLSLDTDDYRRSFDYLQSLRSKSNIHFTVAYDQLIRGQLKT